MKQQTSSMGRTTMNSTTSRLRPSNLALLCELMLSHRRQLRIRQSSTHRRARSMNGSATLSCWPRALPECRRARRRLRCRVLRPSVPTAMNRAGPSNDRRRATGRARSVQKAFHGTRAAAVTAAVVLQVAAPAVTVQVCSEYRRPRSVHPLPSSAPGSNPRKATAMARSMSTQGSRRRTEYRACHRKTTFKLQGLRAHPGVTTDRAATAIISIIPLQRARAPLPRAPSLGTLYRRASASRRLWRLHQLHPP